MTHAHWTFGRWPLRHMAGWHFANAGGRLIYTGPPGPGPIDWSTPIACATSDCTLLNLHLPLGPVERRLIGIRCVAPSGVIELSTHATAVIRTDSQGNMLSPTLARPTDLVLRPLRGGKWVLEFSSPTLGGHAQPLAFEIFRGVDDIDFDHAIATVAARRGRRDYFAILTDLTAPQTLAVRATAEGQVGPMAMIALTTVRSS